MYDKEIKFELAKAALIGGVGMEQARLAYTWVTEVPKVNLDSIKVSDLERSLGRHAVRFRHRCAENDIRTVGELVRMGKTGFRKLKIVGDHLANAVDKALEERFDIIWDGSAG